MTAGAVAIATLIGAVLGVAVHVVLPEVGAAENRTTTQVQVDAARLSREGEPSEVQLERLRTSVFRVGSVGCGETRQATAIWVQGGRGPVLLTNAHVVRGSGTVTLHSFDGTTSDVDVAGSISGRDAAMLRSQSAQTVAGVDSDAVALPVGGAAQIGDGVVVVGYPAGHAAALTGSVVSIEQRTGYGGTTDVMIIDTYATDGSSGSAVLDAAGRVVGLVAARDPGTGDVVAYPIDSVLDGTIGQIPTC